eukprot:TRINITY_DN47226_c0_g2_i1.p1 TRINITY_DN47226_c0_g2~~TRINITY_DN47226_c0_g2_i1.p1  ORF type:complete len:471 (+),score=23.35 TRINITY_DN47226_c0_g2_i1:54-1415(+)
MLTEHWVAVPEDPSRHQFIKDTADLFILEKNVKPVRRMMRPQKPTASLISAMNAKLHNDKAPGLWSLLFSTCNTTFMAPSHLIVTKKEATSQGLSSDELVFLQTTRLRAQLPWTLVSPLFAATLMVAWLWFFWCWRPTLPFAMTANPWTAPVTLTTTLDDHIVCQSRTLFDWQQDHVLEIELHTRSGVVSHRFAIPKVTPELGRGRGKQKPVPTPTPEPVPTQLPPVDGQGRGVGRQMTWLVQPAASSSIDSPMYCFAFHSPCNDSHAAPCCSAINNVNEVAPDGAEMHIRTTNNWIRRAQTKRRSLPVLLVVCFVVFAVSNRTGGKAATTVVLLCALLWIVGIWHHAVSVVYTVVGTVGWWTWVFIETELWPLQGPGRPHFSCICFVAGEAVFNFGHFVVGLGLVLTANNPEHRHEHLTWGLLAAACQTVCIGIQMVRVAVKHYHTVTTLSS